MRSRVLKGGIVRWPDGSVRAEEDQVFEDYCDHNDPEVRRKARVYMRGQTINAVPAPGEALTAPNISEVFFTELREAASKPRVATQPRSPKIAKKIEKSSKEQK